MITSTIASIRAARSVELQGPDEDVDDENNAARDHQDSTLLSVEQAKAPDAEYD